LGGENSRRGKEWVMDNKYHKNNMFESNIMKPSIIEKTKSEKFSFWFAYLGCFKIYFRIIGPGEIAHISNSSYSGGRHQEDCSFWPPWGKKKELTETPFQPILGHDGIHLPSQVCTRPK
jgi:hypothetical protein